MNNDLHHYFICFDCAKGKGGKLPESGVHTCHAGDCAYCKKENITLIPTRDFRWSQKGYPKYEEMT